MGRGYRNTKKASCELLLLDNNSKAMHEGPQKKHWSKHDIRSIKPLTENQKDMFQSYFQGSHLCAYGSAGTGKTFLSLYLAMCDILDGNRDQNHLMIIRSAVSTRDIGFLPGTLEEKTMVYEAPYRDIMADIFQRPSTYDDMKATGLIRFMTTSFVRGLTWDNAVIVIDEIQNMTLAEIDSVLTRVGTNSRVIICGDHRHQCDLKKEKPGMQDFLDIMIQMKSFSSVKFGPEDIVRSGFVKEWIQAREFTKL